MSDLEPLMMTCPRCEGEGVIEVSTAHLCSRRVGECCGGCGTLEACPVCDGARRVEAMHCACCSPLFPAALAVPGAEIAPDLLGFVFCPACARHLEQLELERAA
jgi:hypothetical protein